MEKSKRRDERIGMESKQSKNLRDSKQREKSSFGPTHHDGAE